MAEVVTLGSLEEIDVLKQKIYVKENLLLKKGLQINLEQAQKGKLVMLACNYDKTLQFDHQEENHLFFKQCLANIISELILSYWEVKLIKEVIREQFYFFTPEEKERIIHRSLEIVQTGHPYKCQTIVYQLNRKTKIINRLSEYLAVNNELNIEGFIKFRLKDYMFELNEAVSYAVDEFMMEKEYNEFITLLRYFLEIQEPRLDKVHVVVKEAGKYQLYDHEQKEISSEYLDEFFSDLVEAEINYEDLIISALITIAPKEVVMHVPHREFSKDTMETIEQVFTERLIKCSGCEWCFSVSCFNS